MTIPKKGSRKISVDGVDYRWIVSKYKIISDWRKETELLDEQYLQAASKFGLGDVADVVFGIAIELAENPVSIISAKYFGLVVDGFLGIEQLVSIKPKLISEIIQYSIKAGWNPNVRGNHVLEIVENTKEKHRPALLLLPGFGNNIKNYDNHVKMVQIK